METFKLGFVIIDGFLVIFFIFSTTREFEDWIFVD
jgi:hypothetical protein